MMNKKKILIIVGVIAVMGLVGAIIEATNPPNAEQTKVQASPTASPVVIERYDIQVTSEIVKKVGGKYRYFFSIKNTDTKDFAGSVHIVGKTGSGTMVISQDADFTTQSLKAGLSASVYADANSAPKQVAGDYGAATFTYTATLNKQEVAKGEGVITDKLEDSGL